MRCYIPILLVLVVIATLTSLTPMYSLSISPINAHLTANSSLTTYYILVKALSYNGTAEPCPGARVTMGVCIPNGPCTSDFTSTTNAYGLATFLINKSNYTELLSSSNLNTPPPLLLIYLDFNLLGGGGEDVSVLLPTDYVLKGFFMNINLGESHSYNDYDVSDDSISVNGVRLIYNDVVRAFVLPQNVTSAVTTTVAGTYTTVTRTISMNVTTTITSYVTRTRYVTVTSTTSVPAPPVTYYINRTLTTTTVLTLIRTVPVNITETITIHNVTTLTKFLRTTLTRSVTTTSPVTTTLTLLKTITRSYPVTVSTTLTLTRTLSGGEPSIVTIILSLLIVSASVIALALSKRGG